ncbi:MAG: PQQ-binding-like beta-propeller repeat protein [Ilumatobacteraceae bacterium]
MVLAALAAVAALVVVAVVVIVGGGDDTAAARTLAFTERWEVSLASLDITDEGDVGLLWGTGDQLVFGTIGAFDDEDLVFALDATTGDVLWDVDVAATEVAPRAELVDDTLLVATWDDRTEFGVFRNRGEGMLLALDPETGDERWRVDEIAPMRQAPVVLDGGRVLVTRAARQIADADGEVQVLDIGSGDEVLDIDARDDQRLKLVAARRDLVVVTLEGAGEPAEAIAYAADGDELWRTEMERPLGRWRTIAAHLDASTGPIFIDTFEGSVAFDADDGDELWRTEMVLAGNVFTAPELGVLAVCTDRSQGFGLYVFDLATGDELWDVELDPGAGFHGFSHGAALVSTDGLSGDACEPDLTFATGDDLVAHDPRTGDERWRLDDDDHEYVMSRPSGVHTVGAPGDYDWISATDERDDPAVASLIDPTTGEVLVDSAFEENDRYRAFAGLDGVPVLLVGTEDDELVISDPTGASEEEFRFDEDSSLAGYANGVLYVNDEGRLTAIG